MGLLASGDTYDRARLLDEAARARSRKRLRKSIGLYRRVLAVEPQNGDLHHKLAPLLAEGGHSFDAWISYRTAARSFVREDRLDRALGVYREACERVPHELDAWLETAELLRRHGRAADAVRTLLDGRLHFRRWSERPVAIYLLRKVRSYEPGRVDVILDLAELLASTDQRPEALLLLERAERLCDGGQLRAIRGARFRLTRSVRDAWRWLRTPKDPTSAAVWREAG